MQNSQEYTAKIIQVTFCYSIKEYNLARKNTYVKLGYNTGEVELQDHICIQDGELAAIETGQPVQNPLPQKLLGTYFICQDGHYQLKGYLPAVHTTGELRHRLYQDGFYYNGIKYVRYKRSGGAVRKGKCLFIDEQLYHPLMKWAMCGLKIKPG